MPIVEKNRFKEVNKHSDTQKYHIHLKHPIM